MKTTAALAVLAFLHATTADLAQAGDAAKVPCTVYSARATCNAMAEKSDAIDSRDCITYKDDCKNDCTKMLTPAACQKAYHKCAFNCIWRLDKMKSVCEKNGEPDCHIHDICQEDAYVKAADKEHCETALNACFLAKYDQLGRKCNKDPWKTHLLTKLCKIGYDCNFAKLCMETKEVKDASHMKDCDGNMRKCINDHDNSVSCGSEAAAMMTECEKDLGDTAADKAKKAVCWKYDDCATDEGVKGQKTIVACKKAYDKCANGSKGDKGDSGNNSDKGGMGGAAGLGGAVVLVAASALLLLLH